MDTVLFIRQPQRNRFQEVTPSTELAMIKCLYLVQEEGAEVFKANSFLF